MKLKIVIMAKMPQAGESKTRLIPVLGEAAAGQLSQLMFDHALTQTLAAKADAVVCCMTPDPQDEVLFRQRYPDHICWEKQVAGDLGMKMAAAARQAVAAQHKVLIIGSDCPDLTAEHLLQASNALDMVDVIMGPVTDGGYYLIGMRRYDWSLFADIPWSTATVASETRQRVRKLGWTMLELATLSDIDTPEDICKVPEGLKQALNLN